MHPYQARREQQPPAPWLLTGIAGFIGSKRVALNGDGETSRDFCCIANGAQTKILAATPVHRDFRAGLGQATAWSINRFL